MGLLDTAKLKWIYFCHLAIVVAYLNGGEGGVVGVPLPFWPKSKFVWCEGQDH